MLEKKEYNRINEKTTRNARGPDIFTQEHEKQRLVKTVNPFREGNTKKTQELEAQGHPLSTDSFRI